MKKTKEENKKNIKAAREEIKAILKKYDVSGFFSIIAPGAKSSHVQLQTTDNFCYDTDGNIMIIFEGNDFIGREEEAAEKLQYTIDMLHQLHLVAGIMEKKLIEAEATLKYEIICHNQKKETGSSVLKDLANKQCNHN